MNKLAESMSDKELEQVKQVFLESCIHERRFFNMVIDTRTMGIWRKSK